MSFVGLTCIPWDTDTQINSVIATSTGTVPTSASTADRLISYQLSLSFAVPT